MRSVKQQKRTGNTPCPFVLLWYIAPPYVLPIEGELEGVFYFNAPGYTYKSLIHPAYQPFHHHLRHLYLHH